MYLYITKNMILCIKQKMEMNINKCINLVLKDVVYTFKYNDLEIYCIKPNENDIWFSTIEIAEGLNYENLDQIIKKRVDNKDMINLEDLIGNQLISVNINLTSKEKKIIYVNENGLCCFLYADMDEMIKERINMFKVFIIGNALGHMQNIIKKALKLKNKKKKEKKLLH